MSTPSTRPVVYLHIGEPKTGTTQFQETVWRYRAALAEAGVQLPGYTPGDWFRAMQDLRGIDVESHNPNGSWAGEWDAVAAQAGRAGHTALISQESIVYIAPARMRYAVESLAGTELHIILTVRDFASLLPAEWQETVKHRHVRSWATWMQDIMANEPTPGRHTGAGFWRSHDTVAVLREWSKLVPPERIHVVTLPRKGTSPDLLWQRLAGLIGIADVPVDLTKAHGNSSVGYAEVEFIRALNERLEGRVENWFYAAEVKQAIVHRAFGRRPVLERATLSPDQLAWARKRADAVIDYLRNSSHDIVGDLEDLSSDRVEAGANPPSAPAGVQADAGVAAMAAIVERQFRRTRNRPAAPRTARGRAARYVRSSPRLRRTLRTISQKPGLGWTRVVAWRAVEAMSKRNQRRS